MQSTESLLRAYSVLKREVFFVSYLIRWFEGIVEVREADYLDR